MNEKTSSGLRRTALTDFSGLVGQKFSLHLGPSVILEAELASATKLTTAGEAPWTEHGEREPFSLIFCLPVNSRLDQRIYALEHPVLGRLEIFLVPVALDGQGLHLQAIFN